MSSNLATKLREGTKKAHSMAENMGFVKCFLKGVVEKNSYRKLIGNFYFIYSAMEEEMDRHKDHPLKHQNVASGRSIRRWINPLEAANPPSRIATGIIASGLCRARNATRMPV